MVLPITCHLPSALPAPVLPSSFSIRDRRGTNHTSFGRIQDGSIHPGDGRLEIIRRGRHTKYYGGEGDDANVIMPTIGVDYFNRLFASEEQPGQRTKPQHCVFWSLANCAARIPRCLCT